MEDGVPVYFAKMLPNNPQVELPAVAPDPGQIRLLLMQSRGVVMHSGKCFLYILEAYKYTYICATCRKRL